MVLFFMIAVTILFGMATLLIRLMRKPIKLVFKLLIHAAVGFVALVLINLVGGLFGVIINVNWLSSLIAGIGGVYGVAILLVIRLLSGS